MNSIAGASPTFSTRDRAGEYSRRSGARRKERDFLPRYSEPVSAIVVA